MSYFLNIVVAALAVSPAAAHMIMNTPVPISKGSINNYPLDAAGSDFPCKFSSTYAFSEDSEENTFSIGSADNKLAFTGSAVHGGGSCQVSITKDRPPTKDSVWKVVTSIEGGCPAQNMNDQNYPDNANFADPYTYNFTIPEGLEAGKYTLAWTWFNKVGNREMYMNCALATLEGSGGSSDTFDSLPNMAVANIGGDCSTPNDKNIEYSNPGENLFVLVEDKNTFGSLNCTSGSDGTGASSDSNSDSNSSATSATATVTTSAAYGTGTTPTAGAGGAFLESSTTVSAPATTSIKTAAASSTKTASVTAASTSTAPVSISGSYTSGSACTTEGEWNCIGGTSYQRCASGQWSAVQQMASGLSCTSGVSATLAYTASSRVKRALRLGAKMLRI